MTFRLVSDAFAVRHYTYAPSRFSMWWPVWWLRAAALAALLMLSPVAASAQPSTAGPAEPSGLWLTTPYPELAIKPGKTEAIALTLRNAKLPPSRAEFEVSGVPNGWTWALKGGGREVTAAMVGPDSTERLTLELTPPASADAGKSYPINITARAGERTLSLPLTVRLSENAGGGLKLEPELPALRGSAHTTFSFRVKVTNGGAEENLFNLAANVPQGFQTRFKKGYGTEEITGLPIAAGATETVTLEVVPSRTVAAGHYPVTMQVASGGQSATTALSVDVTGQPQVEISGPQERLSGNAVAGKKATFDFKLTNTGSAPASDLAMSATPPSGWTVSFDPKEIAALAPSATRDVAVKIKPSERAIAGDYMVGIRASGGPVAENVQFRTTVRTSTVWGMAGLGVIAAAVIVLGGAVLRYGRR